MQQKRTGKKRKKEEKITKPIIFWVLIFAVSFLLFSYYKTQSVEWNRMRYDSFLAQVKSGNVKSISLRGKDITGELTGEIDFFNKWRNRNASSRYFKTSIPFENDIDLQKLLESHNVEITPLPESSFWMSMLGSMLPVLLIIGFFWFFLYRQMQAGGNKAFSFGRSRAKLYSENQSKTTFEDVAGTDESKEELQEIIAFLKDPNKFAKLGAKIPKGVLLYGPPGCGKTLLAKAIAGEANVPFYSISGSDFVEMFVGVGASRVRDLFEQAKKHSITSQKGCIVFIDEIDAVGRQRFAGIGGGHDEREQTLNQLLSEMDGFDPKEGVILIAATNRPDVLDAALLRPGRFDRQIEVYSPDLAGREAILKVHSKGVSLAKDINLKTIAAGTVGFSGADLANLINEAALLAARRNQKSAGMKELEEAKERVIAGPERKSRVISENEKNIIAYHEAGHALLAFLIPETDPLHKVSIIPRGGAALGYTMQFPIEDKYLTTRKELLGRMVVYLGGRVAEEMVFNESTTGAQSDLEMVSKIARKMVCEFGMSEKLGPLTFREKSEEVFLGRDITKEKPYSERIAHEIDEEVHLIIQGCYKRAKKMLAEDRDKLDKIVNALRESEVLDGEQVRALLEDGQGKDKKGS